MPIWWLNKTNLLLLLHDIETLKSYLHLALIIVLDPKVYVLYIHHTERCYYPLMLINLFVFILCVEGNQHHSIN